MKTLVNFVMKLKTLLSIFLTICGITCSAQYIFSVQYIPAEPNNNDTINSVTTTLFPFFVDPNTIPMTDYFIERIDSIITVNIFYDVSGTWTAGPQITYTTDTLNWKQTFPPGLYYVYHITNIWSYNNDSLYPVYDTIFHVFTDTTILNINTTASTLNDSIIDYNLIIYPNPVKEYFMIKTDICFAVEQVSITDLLGKEILSYLKGQKYFDTQGLRSGLYFVRILIDKGIFTRRIIVK